MVFSIISTVIVTTMVSCKVLFEVFTQKKKNRKMSHYHRKIIQIRQAQYACTLIRGGIHAKSGGKISILEKCLI